MNKKELNKILEDHKLWVESKGEKGKRAYLAGLNLEGAYLRFAYLYCANLSGANLVGADLRDANLEQATLEDATLEDANLKNAYMLGVNLIGAKFTYEIREARYLNYCSITKDQLPWLALHPKFSRFYPSLTVFE